MRFRLSRPSVGEARPSLVRMDRCVTQAVTDIHLGFPTGSM